MISVGVLGCTGFVGVRYVELLKNHPLFRLTFLAASERNQGKPVHGITISSLDEALEADCELFFSALPSSVARSVELSLAKRGKWVVSSSSTFRKEEDVPVIIPEVNPSHLRLVLEQRKRLKSSSGGIVAKPNCTLQSFVLPLTPLRSLAPLQRITTTNLQALSGAGKLFDKSLVDTIHPHIPLEEEKTESETKKIWDDPTLRIASTCLRVPITHGHMSVVHAQFGTDISVYEVLREWKMFQGLTLPTAPKHPVIYLEEENRPQHALDRDSANKMAVVVGRLSQVTKREIRFVALSHNLYRGAVGGGLLIAELIYDHAQSYLFQTEEELSLC